MEFWAGLGVGLIPGALLVLGWAVAQVSRAEHEDAPAVAPVPRSLGDDDPNGVSVYDRMAREVWFSPEAREGLGWPPEPRAGSV